MILSSLDCDQRCGRYHYEVGCDGTCDVHDWSVDFAESKCNCANVNVADTLFQVGIGHIMVLHRFTLKLQRMATNLFISRQETSAR